MPTAIKKQVNYHGFIPFTPIKKSIKPKNGMYYIGGYASDGSLDYQGERVDPKGLSLKYFKQDGYIDYEHDINNTIGIPVKSYVDNKGFYVEAALFADYPIVKRIISLDQEIRKSGAHRHLGYSIEGQVRKRDAVDPSIIRSILITGVAVTKNPANTDASWSLIQKSMNAFNSQRSNRQTLFTRKGLTTGYGDNPNNQIDGGALRPQSLAYKLHTLSYKLGQLDDVQRVHLYHKTLKYLAHNYSKDIYTPLLALQMFTGCSISNANKAIQATKSESEEYHE